MIVSVGIDMIEIERVASALENPVTGARFRDRVYTQNEIRYCERKLRRKYESYAARFAAKEAVMKSLSVGLGAFAFADVEVVRGPGGAPRLSVGGRAAELAAERAVAGWHLSLTDTATVAVAVAVAYS